MKYFLANIVILVSVATANASTENPPPASKGPQVHKIDEVEEYYVLVDELCGFQFSAPRSNFHFVNPTEFDSAERRNTICAVLQDFDAVLKRTSQIFETPITFMLETGSIPNYANGSWSVHTNNVRMAFDFDNAEMANKYGSVILAHEAGHFALDLHLWEWLAANVPAEKRRQQLWAWIAWGDPIISMYHEFFADVVAVAYYEDPNIVDDIFVKAGTNPDAGRSFNPNKKGVPDLSGHTALFLARRHVWENNMKCLQGDHQKQLFLQQMQNLIFEEMLYFRTFPKKLNLMEANNRMIRRLKELPQCPTVLQLAEPQIIFSAAL